MDKTSYAGWVVIDDVFAALEVAWKQIDSQHRYVVGSSVEFKGGIPGDLVVRVVVPDGDDVDVVQFALPLYLRVQELDAVVEYKTAGEQTPTVIPLRRVDEEFLQIGIDALEQAQAAGINRLFFSREEPVEDVA